MHLDFLNFSDKQTGKMKERFELVEAVVPVPVAPASDELQELQKKIPTYLAGAVANSTADRYHGSFKRFCEFCVENNVLSLPSDPIIIMSYLIKVSENANSAAPALASKSAIRYYNLLHRPDLPSPTDAQNVIMVMKSIERKFSAPVKKSKGTSIEIVKKLINLLNNDPAKFCLFQSSVEDWQVVAKTVVKFYCFARFEEVVALKWSNVKILPQSGNLEITFLKAKNNQFHNAKTSIISKNLLEPSYCPVNIILKYRLVLGKPQQDSFFLPKIVRNKIFFSEPTNYSYCIKKFKLCLQRIGVDPTGFGEHSDRSGGLSTAFDAGCSLSEVQIHGRWRSECTPKLYLKKTEEKRSRVSDQLNAL